MVLFKYAKPNFVLIYRSTVMLTFLAKINVIFFDVATAYA